MSKDTIKKMKRQTQIREMFAKHIFDKGLISRIYEVLL